MGTSLLGIPTLNDQTVWYNERLIPDLTKFTTLGPASVSLGNSIIRKLFNEWGKGKWRGFFEHSTETQCKTAGAGNKHTCYICGFPIRNKSGNATLGSQCEHIIACVQLILLCGLAGEEWEDSIETILNCIGIDPATKAQYKIWRNGIVGNQGVGEAGEGGGRIGISYLYAHPACNALKDNDQFIRIKFNPDGNITIICTVDEYYHRDSHFSACVKGVVPHDHPAWDPRKHIPPLMGNDVVGYKLTTRDCTEPRELKLYSSICWKNIYWILCSLVGYNLILKTQVAAQTGVAAAPKAISDGGSKTKEWRKVVFAPWKETKVTDDWVLGQELSDKYETIFSHSQVTTWGGGASPTLHGNGGSDVYKTIPLMIDAQWKGIVRTEEWIKRRADRIGGHLIPLINSIQTATFEANSKSFGLISALVFAHRLDRKIKRETEKFADFEQYEKQHNRAYVENILSIKFQVEWLNMVISEAEAHNFEIASTAVAESSGEGEPPENWSDWLSRQWSNLVPDSRNPLDSIITIYDLSVSRLNGLKTRLSDQTGYSMDDAISALVACYNYGWVPNPAENATLQSFMPFMTSGGHSGGGHSGRSQSGGMMRGPGGVQGQVEVAHNVSPVDQVAQGYVPASIPYVGVPSRADQFQSLKNSCLQLIENTKADIILRRERAVKWVETRPAEVSQFHLNFGNLSKYNIQGTDKYLMKLEYPQVFAGNFTQYISTKREELMEGGLRAFVIGNSIFQTTLQQIFEQIQGESATNAEAIRSYTQEFLYQTWTGAEQPTEGPLREIMDLINRSPAAVAVEKAGYEGFLTFMISVDDRIEEVTALEMPPEQRTEALFRYVFSEDKGRGAYIVSDMGYFSNFFNLDENDESGNIIRKIKNILRSQGDIESRRLMEEAAAAEAQLLATQLRAFQKIKEIEGTSTPPQLPQPPPQPPIAAVEAAAQPQPPIAAVEAAAQPQPPQLQQPQPPTAVATGAAEAVAAEAAAAAQPQQQGNTGLKRRATMVSSYMNYDDDDDGGNNDKRVRRTTTVVGEEGLYGGKPIRGKGKSNRKSGRKYRRSKSKKNIRRNNRRNNIRSNKNTTRKSNKKNIKRKSKKKSKKSKKNTKRKSKKNNTKRKSNKKNY